MSVWAPSSSLKWSAPTRSAGWTALALATLPLSWLVLAQAGLGEAVGLDFKGFWAAARLVLDGAPATAAYDPVRHGAMQATAAPDAPYALFPYPPTFLLLCLPLGLMPYSAALAVWLGATAAAYWAVLRAWLGSARGLAVAALAFPATLLNVAHGQNAFLTTALFGSGAFLLKRRPLLAGALLGLLIIKPHLGLLIPVALLGARQWRAIAGATASATALVAASLAAFGQGMWLGFPDQLAVQRHAVESGLIDAGLVQTLFAALLQWGAPLPAAYGAQGVLAAAAVVVVAVFAWRRPSSTALGPVLVAATLLVSPYLLDYDLLLAAIPMAWLAAGRARPDRVEIAVIFAVFALPLVARLLAIEAGLPIAPFVLAALLGVTVRRGLLSRPAPH